MDEIAIIDRMILDDQHAGAHAQLRHACAQNMVLNLDVDALRVLKTHYLLKRDVTPKLDWMEPETIDAPHTPRRQAVDRE